MTPYTVDEKGLYRVDYDEAMPLMFDSFARLKERGQPEFESFDPEQPSREWRDVAYQCCKLDVQKQARMNDGLERNPNIVFKGQSEGWKDRWKSDSFPPLEKKINVARLTRAVYSLLRG